MAPFPLVDDILASWSAHLGADHAAYRNHVQRGLHYYVALTDGAMPSTAVLVAAAFHDLGIWANDTFDYLAPSIALARAYLDAHGLLALEAEVALLIGEHHKVSRYAGPFAASVEALRRADLVDLSLGTIRFGLSRAQVRAIRASLPNAGFHRRLAALTLRQLRRSPLRPLPMFRW